MAMSYATSGLAIAMSRHALHAVTVHTMPYSMPGGALANKRPMRKAWRAEPTPRVQRAARAPGARSSAAHQRHGKVQHAEDDGAHAVRLHEGEHARRCVVFGIRFAKLGQQRVYRVGRQAREDAQQHVAHLARRRVVSARRRGRAGGRRPLGALLLGAHREGTPDRPHEVLARAHGTAAAQAHGAAWRAAAEGRRAR